MDFIVAIFIALPTFAAGFVWGCHVGARERGRPAEAAYACLCPRCGWLVSWHGSYLRMPPCCRCGDRPDQSVLRALGEAERW